MNRTIWYNYSSEKFQDALPLGNGSMGAIFHGTLPEGHISLNYDTFWSGTGRRKEKIIPKENLEHARKLIFDEKFYDAQEYIEKNMLGQYNESYIPIGELHYKLLNILNYKNYKRGLDLNTGIAFVEFETDNTKYKIELFSSYPDKIIAIHFKSYGEEKICAELFLDSKIKHVACSNSSGVIKMGGNAPSNIKPNYIESENPITYDENNLGMAFGCCCKINLANGKLSSDTKKLYVNNSSEFMLFVAMDDGYNGFDNKIEKNFEICIKRCINHLDKLNVKTFSSIKNDHVKDYQSLFDKMSIELNGEDTDNKPMDVRLKEFKEGANDLNLITLFFDYNKYLLISSSRKGSQPPTLQGIWNGSIRPVWSSNWTININTEMNYWPVCACNLTECYEPLISFLEDLSISGKETAKKRFHCKGWVANHNIDIWRHTEPVGGKANYAYWPIGGVWLAAQIYDYYSYTLDKDVLRDRIYPVMKGSVEFCLDWLVEGKDNCLHTAPSTSPENTFIDENGRECSISYSSTMDIAVIKELFIRFIEAQHELNIEDSITEKIKSAMDRMPSYKVNSEGKIQEWIKDFKEYDPGHRHFSPVFALYPGTQFKTNEEFEACKKLIDSRISHNHLQIGWSCAWLINIWARMGNGEEALAYLETLLKNSVYNNLFDLHPPLGEGPGEREVFQIDGNFGSASGILEMLIQSSKGNIKLLPALPSKWKNGNVKGILAHGNINVDILWEDGKMKEASFESTYSQDVIVEDKTSNAIWNIRIPVGKRIRIKK